MLLWGEFVWHREGSSVGDKNRIIDYEKIVPQNETERAFFEVFKNSRTVIFDWGWDNLLVVSGESEEDEKIPEKCFCMNGYAFAKYTGITIVTSGDVVLALLCNNKKVDIRNSNPWDPEVKEEFLLDVSAVARRIMKAEPPEILFRS